MLIELQLGPVVHRVALAPVPIDRDHGLYLPVSGRNNLRGLDVNLHPEWLVWAVALRDVSGGGVAWGVSRLLLRGD